MRRREFIVGLGGVVAWPLAVRGQQPDRVRRIGVLSALVNNAQGQTRAKAFQQALEALGWVEGRNIAIDRRWTEGRSEPLSGLAAEFVRLKMEVIVTEGTPITLAAKRATSLIPIIFISVADPVGGGLVESLARPGGNVTGFSNQNRDLAGKRLEVLLAVVPGVEQVAILTNVSNNVAVLEMQEVEVAARSIGLEPIRLEIRRAEDIAPALEAFKGPARAVYVVGDLLTLSNDARINTMALAARLPTVYGLRQQLEVGGLLSYGADRLDLHRRAAGYVDRILRGAKPTDLPVQQPTKFELVVNLTTARALGLTIPETLLSIADELIQ